jgi:mannosyltransferase
VAAAVGLTVLASTTARRVTLGIVVVLGLGGGVVNLVAERTQGGQMARAIAADAGPGDLVAYCPDQLGPATSRYLPEELDGVTFPAFTPPERVDWRDYAERNAAGDPAAFVRSVHERAGDRTIWLAWAGGYRTLEGKCEAVATELSRFRPHAEVVAERDDTFEHSVLYRFPARS